MRSLGIKNANLSASEVKSRAGSERRSAISERIAAAAKRLSNIGVKVEQRYPSLGLASATITKKNIEAILRVPEVTSLYHGNFSVRDAVDGGDISAGVQLTQFIDNGNYTGLLDNGNRLHAAAVESGVSSTPDHPGYFDFGTPSGPGGNSRLIQRYTCIEGAASCNVLNFDTASTTHALVVGNILVGDITQGQDSSIAGNQARGARSSTAREATLSQFAGHADGGRTLTALRHIADHASDYDVVNMSSATPASEHSCTGMNPLDIAANSVFESGIPIFTVAGNDGHGDLNECRTGSPQSGLGTFTVGGHTTSYSDDESDVRYGGIYSNSSRGGTGESSSDGGGRTIIDVTAPAYRVLAFDEAGGYSDRVRGTSFAAPTVTAAAMNFSHWYRSEVSSLIEQPGILYTLMLLMGDRQGSINDRMEVGYNNLWGAGRIKMRRLDPSGLDWPYAWRTGWQCVGESEEVTLSSMDNYSYSGNNADVVKMTAWWYSPDHETGEYVPTINLTLQRRQIVDGQPQSWQNWRTDYNVSFAQRENKRRVFYKRQSDTDDPVLDTSDIRIKLTGGVNFDRTDPVCGQDAIRVNYAAFVEDSERDDSDGPSSEIDPEATN